AEDSLNGGHVVAVVCEPLLIIRSQVAIDILNDAIAANIAAGLQSIQHRVEFRLGEPRELVNSDEPEVLAGAGLDVPNAWGDAVVQSGLIADDADIQGKAHRVLPPVAAVAIAQKVKVELLRYVGVQAAGVLQIQDQLHAPTIGVLGGTHAVTSRWNRFDLD